MAQEDSRLEVIISAKNELLRQKAQESEALLDDFEKGAERTLNKLEEKFSGIGGPNLTNSLNAVRKEFRDTFSDIEKQAASAVMQPLLPSGGLNLGSEAAREAATVARQQAEATRIIAEAATRAAAGEAQLSRETEIYVRATTAAAQKAEQRATALEQEAGALERLEIETAAAARSSGIFDTAQRRTLVSTGQILAAQQQLTYQLGDAVTMWGMGARPMQIFTSQASQVTAAIGLMTNETKGFVGFIGGPWMQVIIAAVTILGVMATQEDEAKDSTIDFSSSLNVANSAAANYVDTLNQLEKATRALINTQSLLIDNSRRFAQDSVSQLTSQLQTIDSEIAKRNRSSGIGDFLFGGIGTLLGAGASNDVELTRLQAERRRFSSELGQAQSSLSSAQTAFESRSAKEAADPNAGGIAQIQRERARLEERRRETLAQGPVPLAGFNSISEDDFRQQMIALDRREQQLQEDRRKKGPSADTLARRAESARQKVLSDDISYTEQERQARHRLLDATQKTASSEEARDQLLREDINAEAQAKAKTYELELSKGKISAAEAAHLKDLNEQNRLQRLQNIEIDKASRLVSQQSETQQHSLTADIALLQIQQDLAATNDERRRIAEQILAKEQEMARAQLQRIIDDPKSTPEAVAQAQTDKDRLPAYEQAQRERLSRQNEMPLERYRRDILETGANLNEAFQSIEVRGLQNLNDGLVDAIMNARSFGDVFKNVAKEIVADLLRIAIQQTIVNQLMGAIGSIFGGSVGSVVSSVTGAKSGAKKGFSIGGYTGDYGVDQVAGVVHGREYVFDAEAVSRIGIPTLEAIRSGRFSGPSPNRVVETASAIRAGGGGVVRIEVAEGHLFEPRVAQISGGVTVEIVRGTAPATVGVAVSQSEASIARRARRRMP